MSEETNPGWAEDLAAHHVADSPPTHWVRAPGRVNLIGEHTDYTEGYVLPVAIDPEIRGLISARPVQESKCGVVGGWEAGIVFARRGRQAETGKLGQLCARGNGGAT